MVKTKTFFKSKIETIKKITWTKPKDLIKNWITVIMFTAFFTVSLFLVDMFISYIFKFLINLV